MAFRTMFTIGHSTRSSDEFVALVKEHGVTLVVDVRTIPRSRHNPQFNLNVLPRTLEAAGIRYLHLAGLGGLRRAKADSPNTGWQNLSFRGFADYMQTEEFTRSLEELLDLARTDTIAVMCAEAVPWRCHRSLIADALTVRGLPVVDVIGPSSVRDHRLTPWAHVEGTRLTYPQSGESGGQTIIEESTEPVRARGKAARRVKAGFPVVRKHSAMS